MGKKKVYSQARTLDFEITNLVSVDIDMLKLRLRNMPESKILEKIDAYWDHYINGCSDDDCKKCSIVCEAFKVAGVRSRLIPNSLRVRSLEILEDTEEEEDDQ